MDLEFQRVCMSPSYCDETNIKVSLKVKEYPDLGMLPLGNAMCYPMKQTNKDIFEFPIYSRKNLK